MKNIQYDGSLTDDLKTLDKNFNPITYFKENINDFFLILLLIGMIILTNAISSLPLGSVVACYTYSFLQIHKRYCKARDKFYESKKDIKEKIDNLGIDLSERKKMHKVLKRSKVFEHVNIQEEMDRYIEDISSDIYYINSEDKIAALREVKSKLKYNDGNLSVTSTKLYKIEDNDLPRKNEMPVRQVLRLRNGAK